MVFIFPLHRSNSVRRCREPLQDGGCIERVLVECVILAANRGRRPLTDLAKVYTDERATNSISIFIYLPVWRAQHNKAFFGSLFAAGELFALARWMFSRP